MYQKSGHIRCTITSIVAVSVKQTTRFGGEQMMDLNVMQSRLTTFRQFIRSLVVGFLMICTALMAIFIPTAAFSQTQSPTRTNYSGEKIKQQTESCIPSGDHTSIVCACW